MKFEELLIMQESEEKQKRMDLQEEVDQLEVELEEELKLSKILKYALDGPIHSCPCWFTPLPFKIKELLTELVTVEEEITWLENKVNKLSLSLYREKKQIRKQSLRRQQNRAKFTGYELQDYEAQKSFGLIRQRRSSVGSSGDIKYSKLTNHHDIVSYSRCENQKNLDGNPNKLSEDLMNCLIGIFMKMNRPLLDGEEGLDIVRKQCISCMNSKSFISKTTFNFFTDNGSNNDPYATLLDFDGVIRDIGPYKSFTQITRNTLDHTRISECSTALGKLRVLMQKLGSVDLNLMTYKQKLAFWINIYNACIMHVLRFYNTGCLRRRRNYWF